MMGSDALGYGFGDSLVLSPLAESEDSVISELSSRADRTRSDVLETKDPQETEEAKLRPLHRTTRATSSDDLYEELDHIYEELDNYRSKSIVTPEISDSSSTLKEEDSSESEECSGYAPVADIIEELKTPEVERVQPQQHLEQQQEMTLSEYRPICRVRKAHPDGLMFPRITATVPTLPELPEEHEISTLPAEGDHGSAEAASVIPYVDESPRFSAQLIMPSDLTSTEEQSKRAVLRSQAQVVADQHKLVIRGWESLFSDSEESC
ncbi:hypothetical protein NECAME_01381 [Necator americanus]|uniref:Uncharacterized protein n=1 Tax=Necator americanus TaxID=51031 RepID=W2TZ07_NECAM|nr:hypothetical protein NECAME_01381 [Necator americanus]ETN86252.1 hypothetical protein NECAME_01381 [Necator americanus]